MQRGVNDRGLAAPAAAPARDMRFESAKAASAQRAVTNAVALDSLATANGRLDSGTRRVEGRTFVLRDAVWTDVRFKPDMQKTVIKPFSKAYFDIVAQLPELRSSFALGSRVIVVGKARAIELSDSGEAELSPAALATLLKAW
jgi:hypothetical protein